MEEQEHRVRCLTDARGKYVAPATYIFLQNNMNNSDNREKSWCQRWLCNHYSLFFSTCSRCVCCQARGSFAWGSSVPCLAMTPLKGAAAQLAPWLAMTPETGHPPTSVHLPCFPYAF